MHIGARAVAYHLPIFLCAPSGCFFDPGCIILKFSSTIISFHNRVKWLLGKVFLLASCSCPVIRSCQTIECADVVSRMLW